MFRKRKQERIEKHKNEASLYIQSKYQLSETGKVQYSPRTNIPDAIKKNDAYNADTVSKAMSDFKYDFNARALSSTLENVRSTTFVDCLYVYLRQNDLKDSAVYKAAQIDRRLYSKIKSDKYYKPAKDTAIALAFALKLTLEEAKDLLSRAGYCLSHSNKRDIVIEYFFQANEYDIDTINSVLTELGEKILGK